MAHLIFHGKLRSAEVNDDNYVISQTLNSVRSFILSSNKINDPLELRTPVEVTCSGPSKGMSCIPEGYRLYSKIVISPFWS